MTEKLTTLLPRGSAVRRRRAWKITQPDMAWKTIRKVEGGLPFSTIEELAAQLDEGVADVARVARVPPKTLARRREAGSFTSLESDRIARLGRVFGEALRFFDGDEEAARTWLRRKRPALRNHAPLELAATDAGAREVERLLLQLDHGVVP